MSRNTLFTLAVALLGACTLDSTTEPDNGAGASETGEDYDVTPPIVDAGTDEPIPGPFPVDPTPGGRITSVGHEDGDLVVTATVDVSVLAHYPDADHYAIRFDDEQAWVIVALIGVEGDAIEELRIRRTASVYYATETALSMQLPAVPPPRPDGCLAEVCPWAPGWPAEGALLDDLELSEAPPMLRIHGRFAGHELHRSLILNPENQDVLVTESSVDPELGRLIAVTAILTDLGALTPELEVIDDCLWCSLGGIWTIGKTGSCVAGILAE